MPVLTVMTYRVPRTSFSGPTYPIAAGVVPTKRLLLRSNTARAGRKYTSSVTVPESLLCDSLRDLSELIRMTLGGRRPERSLWLTSRCSRMRVSLNIGGQVPVNWLSLAL